MNMFDNIKFIYFFDYDMKKKISSIDIKLSKIKITNSQKIDNLVIKSKVRSIHSSLSIEANSLSLFDIENINNDKSVIVTKDEIQEVKKYLDGTYSKGIKWLLENYINNIPIPNQNEIENEFGMYDYDS